MRHSLSTGIAILALALGGGCARDRSAALEKPTAVQPASAPEAIAEPERTEVAERATPVPKPAPAQAPPAATKPSPLQQTEQGTAQQPARRTSPPPSPKPPSLDLSSLEQRLRGTNAIGTLTKLTLKNQVDDLLDQFRSYYQGRLKTDLTALRRSYDLLLLKIVALLQDDDEPLANAIVASREEIWGILSDRTKFATL